MQKLFGFFSIFFIMCLPVSISYAAEGNSLQKRVTQCVERAQRAPDQVLAETESWLKKGGDDRARLCRAFALFYRGDYGMSARELEALAGARETTDRKHAASLHAQAGLAYTRANEHKRAEAEYGAALKLEPHDPEIWIDRAVERLATEHYWEAIDDLTRALEIMPDMSDALRLRGQAWVKLGQTSRAREDLERAEILDEADAEAERGKKGK